MIDDAAAFFAASQRTGRETHGTRLPISHTGAVTTTPIRFGRDIPDDAELRLCGDLSHAKRALELGVSRHRNALAMAQAGVRAIAVDPDLAKLDDLRQRAAELEITVQGHHGDLADLGFATSGSIDLVVADHSLVEVDDFGRLLRQVHRVMRSSRPFVISVPHPFAGVFTTDQYGSKVHPYGTAGRTIGDWFIHLARANFRVDQIHELGVSDTSPVPTTLVLRAVKEGD